MKRVILPLLFLATSVQAKTLVVAVIDTGVDKSVSHLCKMGHRDFVKTVVPFASGDPLVDVHGHGTHIAGLIAQNAGSGDYCIVSLRYYRAQANDNLLSMKEALKYAIAIKADVINISAGGNDPDLEEKALIKRALDQHITVVTAAGNDHNNLDVSCRYYPACYDKREVVVGNLEITYDSGKYRARIADTSNYGSPINRWEVGTNCLSNLPGGGKGRMSGTSQAAAVATGKIVKSKLSSRRH